MTHLENQISLLHAQIRRNVFVYRPRKLVVEFPGDDAQKASTQRDDTRNGNEIRSEGGPDLRFDAGLRARGSGIRKICNRIFDLTSLNCRIHQKSQVVNAQSDDLDGVAQTQCIPGQNDLVEETEYKERKVGIDGLCRGLAGVSFLEVTLEFRKDVAGECQSQCLFRTSYSACQAKLTLQEQDRLQTEQS